MLNGDSGMIRRQGSLQRQVHLKEELDLGEGDEVQVIFTFLYRGKSGCNYPERKQKWKTD